MLKSSLCAYSDAYRLVKGTITYQHQHQQQTQIIAIRKQHLKIITITQTDSTRDIDVVMLIYNLI